MIFVRALWESWFAWFLVRSSVQWMYMLSWAFFGKLIVLYLEHSLEEWIHVSSWTISG